MSPEMSSIGLLNSVYTWDFYVEAFFIRDKTK